MRGKEKFQFRSSPCDCVACCAGRLPIFLCKPSAQIHVLVQCHFYISQLSN